MKARELRRIEWEKDQEKSESSPEQILPPVPPRTNDDQ